MSVKTIQGSAELGSKIRLRRNELGLTIEEAASKAGVGTKTWCRYESGESIRRDKAANVCKTLNWHVLPCEEDNQPEFDIDQYKKSKVWPQALADSLGDAAALSFVIGSDILFDYIHQDLQALSRKPRGTHVGELELSWMKECLPPQFLMRYDYDFLYGLKDVLVRYRNQAKSSKCFVAHTVAEELVLYRVMEESEFLMENILPQLQLQENGLDSDWNHWAFDLFDDMDVVTFLYSDFYLGQGHPYHFDHWWEEQFYTS